MSGRDGDVEPARLAHLDEHGRADMVDVSAKPPTERRALARCRVMSSVLEELTDRRFDILEQTARVAAAQAAKQTALVIPLCHPLLLDSLDLEFTRAGGVLEVTAEARIVAMTGVEMEALTACAVAGLTVVCELLGADPAARVEHLELLEKAGGRSGEFVRESESTEPG